MLLVAFFIIAVTGAVYQTTPRVCLPWLTPLATLPVGIPVASLSAACDAHPLCNAFDTNGRLFLCPHGRCDCDAGEDVCLRGLDVYTSEFGCNATDLYVAAGTPPPLEWLDDISAARILYGSPESTECYLPEIGNGYLATTVTWGALHVAGLFNGRCGTVRKARLPSPVAITLTGGGVQVLGGGLDVANGMYRRRYGTSDGAVLEQRFYAHRVFRNVVVVEIELVSGDTTVAVNTASLWAPTATGIVPPDGHVPGDNCASGFTEDLVFSEVTRRVGSKATLFQASTTLPGDKNEMWNVTMVVEDVPATLTLTANNPVASFVHVIVTSLEADTDAVAVYTSLDRATLYATHTAAWGALNQAGIEVTPMTDADTLRALDIATHAASSQYYLFSSARDDWAPGVSPGGISSGSYNGAVFMDMDLWMQPALYFLHPKLARAMLEYRYVSVAVMTDAAIATTFGYNGTMYAWTAAYEGRPFGCCDGTGGYEDCLEQHVTGAVPWSAWQYWLSTGNVTWLRDRGWPILAGAADFHMSRVTLNGDGISYSVRGVLPIDEWCVGSGCGCETPGVDDDAETNAGVILSLLNAATAADILNLTSPRTVAWRRVGSHVVILFNETGGHHNQFTSPTCPNGWGGTHYTQSHTVCPEDVMLLTYPFGDALNTTTAVSRADADVFIPITCKENAGMTTPIHTIVWLMLGEVARATAELNRSMHAACYGPFHVRNEVDAHADMYGGHFNNTKFLTGDGGYLQALINGYGGLRIVDNGLKMLRPTLPESVGVLTLRRMAWRGRSLTFRIAANAVTITVVSGEALVIEDANKKVIPLILNRSVSLSLDTFSWPGLMH